MKRNNNHHNLSCNFAEDAVAFLYGEMSENEKAKFEKHLSLCSHCEEELAVLASAHSSILNWKTKEFDVLSLPIIEIPYETEPESVKNVEISRNWLDSLRELFSFSPINLAAAACAILVVGLGLMFFVFDFSTGKKLADSKNGNSVMNEISQPIEKTIEPETDPKPPVEEIVKNEPDSEARKAENKSQTAVVKTKSRKKVLSSSAEIAKTQNTPKRLNNSPTVKNLKTVDFKQTQIEARIQQAPRLNNLPEEIEDKSLRLTDLLADLDTK